MVLIGMGKVRQCERVRRRLSASFRAGSTGTREANLRWAMAAASGLRA